MNDSAIKRRENKPPHPDSENAAIARGTQEDTKFRRSQASKHNFQYKSHKRGGSISIKVQELVLSAIKKGSFDKLPQRGKDLLTLHYLQTGKPLTLDEIGKKMGGISRQRGHELEQTALDYLQGNKTTLEQLLGGNPKKVLEDLSIKQGLSMTDIANRFHKTPSTVSQWFKKFDIRIPPRLVRQYILREKSVKLNKYGKNDTE